MPFFPPPPPPPPSRTVSKHVSRIYTYFFEYFINKINQQKQQLWGRNLCRAWRYRKCANSLSFGQGNFSDSLCQIERSLNKESLLHYKCILTFCASYAAIISCLICLRKRQLSSFRWKTIKKSLFRNWPLIQNFFIAHLSILVRCKTKAGVGALCALRLYCAFGNSVPNGQLLYEMALSL